MKLKYRLNRGSGSDDEEFYDILLAIGVNGLLYNFGERLFEE